MGVYRYKKDSAGEWRWRYVADNGKIIAVSSEGYAKKDDCLYGITIMKASYGSGIEEG